MATTSPHAYNLASCKPFFESEYGSIQRATADSMPILKGMSLKRLTLKGRGIREPHWHANCLELTYCLSGSALVSITDDHSKFSSFTVSAGQIFYVDSGSLHHIENVSDDEDAEFLVCFNHERPEDFSLGASYGAMTPAVLGNAFNVSASDLSQIKLSTQDKHIVARDGSISVPKSLNQNDPHKFDCDGSEPQLKGELGEVHQAKAQFWPAIKSLAMYSLKVEDVAMREPHWHPITAELGYVHKGEARMTVMDPKGNTDTYTLKPGDMYYVPPAYPHQIECLPQGEKEIHFCIFFDQPMPQDIGYKSTINGLPHEAIAATLGISRKSMPKLEGTDGVPLVVKRVNPVDPVASWTKSKI